MLLVNLKQGMHKALIDSQLAGLAACVKAIITLDGLAADSLYENRERGI